MKIASTALIDDFEEGRDEKERRLYREAKEQINAGVLDEKFSKYGPRQVSRVLVGIVKTAQKVRMSFDTKFSQERSGVSYGRVEIVPVVRGGIWVSCDRDRGWFDTFLAQDIKSLLAFWDQPLPLTSINPSTSNAVHALEVRGWGRFKANRAVAMLGRLRSLDIQVVRFFTFGDPFMSDVDRLTYLGERV